MPLAILGKEENSDNFLNSSDNLDFLDLYVDLKIEELKAMAEESTAVDLKRQYEISDINQTTFDNILDRLEEIKETLYKRIS